MTQPSSRAAKDETTRRDALRALAAASGALSLAALPDEWTTPVVNAGALPPHAQASCFALRVTATESGGGDFDWEFTQGPTPDTQEASGTILSWLCGATGCLWIIFSNTAGGGNVHIELVTPTDSDSEDIGPISSGNWWVIDLSTGEIGTNLSQPSGCLG